MGRRWLASVATLAAVAPATGGAAATPTTAHVTVKPASGSPRTQFRVSFKAPASSGRVASTTRRYELYASDRARRGCVSSASAPVGDVAGGQRVHVTLAPGPHRMWCPGRFSGRLDETIVPVCPPRELCPDFIAVVTVGRFSFRVTSR